MRIIPLRITARNFPRGKPDNADGAGMKNMVNVLNSISHKFSLIKISRHFPHDNTWIDTCKKSISCCHTES